MKKKYLYYIFPVLLILSLIFSGCEGAGINTSDTKILTFDIIAGGVNASISADITGVIEETADGGTITITVPEAFDYANKLTPTITISDQSTVSPQSGTALDFSINPLTFTVYNDKGDQSVYNVVAKRAVVQAPAGSVFISEIFNGNVSTVTTGTRIDNAYIELYNNSASDIDLSQFSLRFLDSETTADLNYDFTTPLSGTIQANSTYVIFNQFIDSSTMNSLNLIVGTSDSVSDLYHNGVTSLDGNDSVELLQNGEVVDVFDPSGNKANLPGYSVMKKFVRKGGKGVSLTWNDYDWILYPVNDTEDDDDTVGDHSTAVDSEAKDLTYFAFEEGFDNPVIAFIDNALNSVYALFPTGTDISALKAVFGTSGSNVTVGGSAQESAITVNDFTSSVDYTVWAANSGTKTYTVSSLVLAPTTVSYTTQNYDFNGNIQAVLDRIGTSEADVDLSSVSSSGYSGVAGTVTGVVTAKDIYGHKDSQKCFFIQDKDAGLYIFSAVGVDSTIDLGSKITVPVITGKVYFDMPEVVDHGKARLVEQNIPIYYETGDYANAASLGKVFQYSGSIAAGMDGFSVGQFSGDLYFHSDRDFADALAQDKTGTFYGPIVYSYSKYRMEINSPYQIVQ